MFEDMVKRYELSLADPPSATAPCKRLLDLRFLDQRRFFQHFTPHLKRM